MPNAHRFHGNVPRPFLMVGLTQFLDSFLSYHPSLAVKGEVIMMRNTSPKEVKLYLERMPLPKNNQTVLVKNKGVWNRVGIIDISVWPTQPFGPRPPLGGKEIFQKEQPVMIKKPSLSIHIELYIIYPFPNNKY